VLWCAGDGGAGLKHGGFLGGEDDAVRTHGSRWKNGIEHERGAMGSG